MSRNNSVSTTETASSTYTYPSASLSHLSVASTAHTSVSSLTSQENRVISDFNPTLVLYIPNHGGLARAARGRRPSAELAIHDVTAHLPGFNHNTLRLPDTLTMEEIMGVVSSRRWETEHTAPPVLVSRRNGSLSSRNTVALPGNSRDSSHMDAAEWRVPWDVMKPANMVLKGNDEKRVEVWCGKENRRSQRWVIGRERFFWRWTQLDELVLEKESEEMGSHQIGAFLFNRHSKFSSFGPLATTGGTLILDERGLSRIVAITTMLILLKRERQRRSIGGRTPKASTSGSRRESI